MNFGFDLPGYLDNLVEEMEARWNRVPVAEMLLAIDRDEERMNMQGGSGREGLVRFRDSEAQSGTTLEKKKDDRGSTRNYNLLIRSQTRYHYATRPAEAFCPVIPTTDSPRGFRSNFHRSVC